MTEIEPISDALPEYRGTLVPPDGQPDAWIIGYEDGSAGVAFLQEELDEMLDEALTGAIAVPVWSDVNPARPDAARILHLEAQIAALQAERAWKPIETAPHGINVLLYCPDRGITNPARVELGPATSGTSNAVSSSMSSHAWATHWTPLPSLPTEETDNDR